ncbi:hypothetical protein [Bacillus thuringiensis]|uniref:hypothetical protein n=1 Tax=Bacillus thuringiensis TaxID=1428 RepID=UPI00159B9D95|nr:hypothetical protein [Bacillus thuringiensis]
MSKICEICKKEIQDGVIRLMQPADIGGINHYHIACKNKKDTRIMWPLRGGK